MTTTATLKKWGNGIALRFPSAVAKAVNLVPGSQVEIHVSEHDLTLRKAPSPARIGELCAAITPENLHLQTEWGTPQGKEIW